MWDFKRLQIIGNNYLICAWSSHIYKKFRMSRYDIKRALSRQSCFVFGKNSSHAESTFFRTRRCPRNTQTQGKQTIAKQTFSDFPRQNDWFSVFKLSGQREPCAVISKKKKLLNPFFMPLAKNNKGKKNDRADTIGLQGFREQTDVEHSTYRSAPFSTVRENSLILLIRWF